ncbi:hypothetical protein SDC9_77031 [bioreactor metagenome]|uniref:Uncharacterized protein n=1 Tax=bioreactor metagenome TaxID=1076179 RepID=A0A644YRH8_9ZZZZ
MLGDAGGARPKMPILGDVRTQEKNWSGSTSIVVVDKSEGTYREVKSFGSSSDVVEITRLHQEASNWISKYGGQQLFDFDETEKVIVETKNTLSRIERMQQNAPQAILNKIYDSIGFSVIDDDILRHLVVARVCQPLSKVATVGYLKSYPDEDVHLHNIYRYMDRLYSSQ